MTYLIYFFIEHLVKEILDRIVPFISHCHADKGVGGGNQPKHSSCVTGVMMS